MRIVIDMQGAQTESRFRGIGRYTMSFAQAVVRNRGEHEVILALNGFFPDTIEPIRAAFDGLLPQENIRVWYTPGPVAEENPANDDRRNAAELIREAFLASLQPDVIHISSLFEGYVDDAVTSIGRLGHTGTESVSLYDLIPLLNPKDYLAPNPRYERYYLRKIEYLKQAVTYLAISECARQEGLAHFESSESSFINVSTAIDQHFEPLDLDDNRTSQLTNKFNLTRPFILYAGGADERKNLPRLIQAYAALPTKLRENHQLLLAGKMPDSNIAAIREQAKSVGIEKNELCFTGYISDEELVLLYNLCKLFVFPSWHEGFGLPALEAMACGAPVIGANTSSLPEVIGLDDALFDPFDVVAISAKMACALEDDLFLTKLREHGMRQVKRFSWDKTAKRAIAVWETLPRSSDSCNDYLIRTLSTNRLLSTLVNQRSFNDNEELINLASCIAQNQIAAIERQLLLDVSELSQRDAATGVQRVVRSYLKYLLKSPPPGFRVEPVYAARDEGYRYARRFTKKFLILDEGDETDVTDEPIRWQRGDIFFGLDMQHHVQLAHERFYQQLRLDGVTVKFLVHDLLPIQLSDLFKDSNAKELHEQWLTLIAATDGAICVSKATADALSEWLAQRGITPAPNFHLKWVHNGGDIESSGLSQEFLPDAQQTLDALCNRPTFLCVATLEPRKGQQQILGAIELLWNEGKDINLVLVGQEGWKVESLAEKIRSHEEQGQRLFWLQGISDEYLELVYSASTCLVAASINEGFGLPVIEAARHDIPIIARDIPVFREVAGDSVFYFKGDAPHELAEAMKVWLNLYQKGRHPRSDSMSWSTWRQSTEKLKAALIQNKYPRRQLLVDISELIQRDAKTGIQRVVRSILKEWLINPPDGFRVEPVYATVNSGYYYARQFTRHFLGSLGEPITDEPIEYAPGDVFLGLDLQPQVQVKHRSFYQEIRCRGVRVLFVVYDLICIRMPHYFIEGSSEGFSQWLEVVAESDGAVCISNAVADELTEWFERRGPFHPRPFSINWFHLGADVANSEPTKGLPSGAENLLSQLLRYPIFLMLGTLEPRKGHEQVLDTFEHLWADGIDVNLIIVGKQGWMVEKLVERLRVHPELNQRLFWLDGISDEYLEKIYATSTCLIAASYGEGFGLPLIEAAQHNLPIIARDIPVFREVAGQHAFYFKAEKAKDLANAIKKWLALYEREMHPKSDDMPWLTWKESAENLTQICVSIESF